MSETAPESQVEVSPALNEEQPVVERLLELYIHDLSEYFEVAVKEDGRFGYPQLPLYWSESGRYPFLIRVNGRIAGVVLVRRLDRVESGPVWDIAEFFVMRSYRRHGTGACAARAVWSRFPGRWQVRVLKANGGALEFWERTIRRFSGGAFGMASLEAGGAEWSVFSFLSRATSDAAETAR